MVYQNNWNIYSVSILNIIITLSYTKEGLCDIVAPLVSILGPRMRKVHVTGDINSLILQ